MIVCAGNGEYFAFAKSIGIGLCESTIGLMQICMRECIDSIVFVGSAGAYSKDINIGDVCIADSATEIEIAFLDEKAYTPLDNHIESNTLGENDYVSRETLNRYKKVIVNSSNYITTDGHIALAFANAGIALENMEFFAVMRVAQYFEIPCVGVFAVSNYCHQNAHKEFMQNHNTIKQKLLEHSSFIENLSLALGNKTKGKHI